MPYVRVSAAVALLFSMLLCAWPVFAANQDELEQAPMSEGFAFNGYVSRLSQREAT